MLLIIEIPLPNDRLTERNGRNLDVKRVNIGKASKETGKHVDLPQDTKIHLQGQYFDAWNHGSWACHHVCLQCSAPGEIRIILIY